MDKKYSNSEKEQVHVQRKWFTLTVGEKVVGNEIEKIEWRDEKEQRRQQIAEWNASCMPNTNRWVMRRTDEKVVDEKLGR